MIWDGRCPKHDVEMPVVQDTASRHHSPLHRCPMCCAEFRGALAKAERQGSRNKMGRKPNKQRTLRPVIMSERWP